MSISIDKLRSCFVHGTSPGTLGTLRAHHGSERGTVGEKGGFDGDRVS